MLCAARREAAFALARPLARLIAGASLCAVERVGGPAGAVFRKRRRAHAGPLGLAARLAGARFVQLPTAEWRAWEAAVYRQVYGLDVTREPDGALRLPLLPGEPLAAFLSDTQRDWEARRAALAAAAAALAELHQLSITLPGGARPFSHGDATARNVLYDPGDGRARWFDFETGHPRGRPHAWRRADDLRALLFSAAGRVGAERAGDIAAIACGYPDLAARAELRAMAQRLSAWPDSFHLAQAGDGPAQWALGAALSR